MRKLFKRSTDFIVTSIFLGIFIFYLIRMIQVRCAEGNLFEITLTQTGLKMTVKILFTWVAFLIAQYIVPPDFKYFINVSKDWIVFEISKEDHRRIDRNFIIASQNRYYIVLDDGFSRICIAYNKEVLQFLNEINN